MQKFNAKVKKKYSVHPQITCRDAINRLRNAKFLCKADVTNCFYHLSISKKMRGALSFVYANQHYTPQVLMHGLVFASSIWCAVFSKLIRRANLENNVVFLIDDLFVIAQTKQEYME